MKRAMSVRRGHGMVVGLLLLAGCGAVPGPRQSQPPVAPEPSTIEEAQARLDQEEARLKRLALTKKETYASPPPSAPAPVATATATAEAPASPQAGGRAEEGGCQDACRALSSMKRAADTICRLAGPEDARCQTARRRVQEGEERTSTCGCKG